ncbi:MAG: alpha/beta hydrolase [Candidatus Nanopelagicales bacterium]
MPPAQHRRRPRHPVRLAAAAVAASALVLAGCSTVTPTASPGGDVSWPGTSASGSPSPTGSTDPSGGPTDPELEPYYSQRLAWQSCGGSFQCADLTVPLSYDDPSGETIQIAVLRSPATGSDPIGSLVLNPGGPGGSGIDYARAARFVVSEPVLQAYDVVGFDPRGVGESAPIQCLTGPETDRLFAADGTPDDAAEVKQTAAVSELLGQRCEERSGDLLPYVGTRDAARDMDILRAALGDEQLNYLGKSYGTYLGAVYAEEFPQRVGRMVLDGVLAPDLNAEQITLGQAKAFEVALEHFVEDCGRHSDCPLTGDVEQGVQQVRNWFAALEQEPIPAQPGRPLNEALATYAVLSYLYFPSYDWPLLRDGLSAGIRGDGTVLMDMLDQRIDRAPDGSYTTNGTDAFYAVSCLDRPVSGGVARAEQLSQEWATEAPTFGPYLAWGNLPCDGWPAPPTEEPHVITADGSGPILVVSTKYDPATPYEWGVSLAEQLSNAALVSWDGDGHTAYMEGSACVDSAVDGYLLTGAVPEQDPLCQ